MIKYLAQTDYIAKCQLSDRKPGPTRRSLIASLCALAALKTLPAIASENGARVTLSLGAAASKAIPLNYVGLSYETSQLADPDFFAADNPELISLFRALNPSGVLRIGGNSSEFCWWKAKPSDRPPEMPASAHSDDNWMPQSITAVEPVAINRLAGFLDATEWQVIYGLNLGTGTPARDAEEASYVAKTLGSRLLFFQIGNEPEFYRDPNNRLRGPDWDFDKYFAEWIALAQAVIERVPDARLGGPDVGSNADWVVRFAEEAPKHFPGRIVACTGHYYAEGPPDSPQTTVARLLGPDPKLDENLARSTQAAAHANLQYRMTEGNSCYRGGMPGMSNAFCAALWAAEFMLKLASYGAAGVNLHGGGTKQIRLSLGGHLPGEGLTPEGKAAAAQGSFYTPIAGSRESGFIARPVFYGMKVAGLLAGGRMRSISFDPPLMQSTAWAAEMTDGSTRVIVLNKDPQQRMNLEIRSTRAARLWRLQAPDLTATSGVSLAGATIEVGHEWKPKDEEHLPSRVGKVQAILPHASAAVLFFDHGLDEVG